MCSSSWAITLPAAPKFTALGSKGLSYPQNPSKFLAPILQPSVASIIHHNIGPLLLGNLEWPIPGVARVEKRGLEESGWEDHHMVRY